MGKLPDLNDGNKTLVCKNSVHALNHFQGDLRRKQQSLNGKFHFFLKKKGEVSKVAHWVEVPPAKALKL